MKPPENVKIFEGELATFWFDEDGILYALGKNVPRNAEKQKENYKFIKKITGNKKVCLISGTTHGSPMDKDTRDYIASELPNVFKAMAVVSDTVYGQVIPKTFIALKQEPIPIKMFTNGEEAKEWIKHYL